MSNFPNSTNFEDRLFYTNLPSFLILLDISLNPNLFLYFFLNHPVLICPKIFMVKKKIISGWAHYNHSLWVKKAIPLSNFQEIVMLISIQNNHTPATAKHQISWTSLNGTENNFTFSIPSTCVNKLIIFPASMNRCYCNEFLSFITAKSDTTLIEYPDPSNGKLMYILPWSVF